MTKIPEMSVQDLQKKLGEVKVIDVRRPEEHIGELGHIKGAIFATLETDLEDKLNELPKEDAYVFVCRSGGRSSTATQMALQRGFRTVFNMVGGMLEWNKQGLPVSKAV